MLIVLIDSRFSIDTETLFRIPNADDVILLTIAAQGCEGDGVEQLQDTTECIAKIFAKHAGQAIHLVLLWRDMDQILCDLSSSLCDCGILPKKTFVFLAHLPANTAATATGMVANLESAWRKGLPTGHRNDGAPDGYRLMIGYLGEQDSQKQQVGDETRNRLLESLTLLFRRGGNASFLALSALYERQPGAVQVRAMGFRHWMPTISEIRNSLSGRLRRALHRTLQLEMHDSKIGGDCAGHARDEVTDLRSQLLAISLADAHATWPAHAKLHPQDWVVPLWQGKLDSSLNDQLKSMDTDLRNHARNLVTELATVAAEVRSKSHALLGKALSASRDYTVGDPRISFLARLLQSYYPEFRKLEEELPKGAESSFTPAGSPALDEISARILAKSVCDAVAGESGGLLSVRSIITWLIPLVVGLAASWVLLKLDGVPWYWLCAGPLIGLIAVGVRFVLLARARKRIKDLVVQHIAGCQAWLCEQYAEKAERVRVNARRLALVQFLRRQHVVGARLGALLAALVTDWKMLLADTTKAPAIPDLGVDDNRAFSEIDGSFSEELQGLPVRLADLAWAEGTLGAGAASLEDIVSRQIPRLFDAHSEIIAPIDRLKSDINAGITDPRDPPILAPATCNDTRQRVGKCIVVPGAPAYRDWARSVRDNLPAIPPVDLEFADAPLWAPVIFVFGPPHDFMDGSS